MSIPFAIYINITNFITVNGNFTPINDFIYITKWKSLIWRNKFPGIFAFNNMTREQKII